MKKFDALKATKEEVDLQWELELNKFREEQILQKRK
jgi:hypothetical protein